jgi:hypothetical protein
MNSRNWQYLGRRKGEFIGLHAMILVGIRKEGELMEIYQLLKST